ncbi:MAG: hypothetical protein ACOCRO_08730, partial [Halanaerobiales bacterium]
MKKFIVLLVLALAVISGCSESANEVEPFLKFDQVYESGFNQALIYFNDNIDNFSDSEKIEYANQILQKLDEEIHLIIDSLTNVEYFDYRIDDKKETLYVSKSYEQELSQAFPNEIVSIGASYYISDGSQIEENGLRFVLKSDLILGVNNALENSDLDQKAIDHIKMLSAIPNVYYKDLETPFNSYEATEGYAEVLIKESNQLDLFINENVWKTSVYLPLDITYEKMSSLVDVDPNGEVGQSGVNVPSTNEALIEAKEDNGIQIYWAFKPNTEIHFDLNQDDIVEKLFYDTDNHQLIVNDDYMIDLPRSINRNHFLIMRYNDKTDSEMFLVGIEVLGDSSEQVETKIFALIEPMGEKWFGSIGSVNGKIVIPNEYDILKEEDFNAKAVLRYGDGIEAPVKLDAFEGYNLNGRTLHTYYSPYKTLVDNVDQYNRDYIMKLKLKLD